MVDVATGGLVGFEALSRWTRPGHGPVSPALFVAMAEESGLIADLGDHVLYVAARQFARWRTQGLVRSRQATTSAGTSSSEPGQKVSGESRR